MADAVEVPAFLQKQGIRSVSDNLGEGQQVALPKGLITMFFGDELQKRFVKPVQQVNVP